MPWRRAASLTSARGIGPLAEHLERHAGSVSAIRVFDRNGIPFALAREPERKLPLLDLIALYETAARATGDPLLGFEVGKSMVSRFGPWVDYAAAAPTLKECLARASRGIRFHQSGTGLTLEVRGDAAFYSYHVPVDRDASGVQHLDHTVPALQATFRRYLGEGWRPDLIELKGPSSSRRALLEDALGTPVVTGKPALTFVFPARLLMSAKTEEPAAQDLTFRDLKAMVRARPKSDSLGDVVLDLIHMRLVKSASDIDGLAARLRLGPRTLQRRLAVEGLNYRTLLQEARMQRASALLRETTKPVAEIAFDLGYGDPAHFARSFRKALGLSPSQYRKLSS